MKDAASDPTPHPETHPEPVGEHWPTIEEVVRNHLLATLDRHGWNLTLAAGALGVSLKTVYNRLNKYEAQGFVVHEGKYGWRRTTCPTDST